MGKQRGGDHGNRIYFIKVRNRIKIGVTKNLKQRLLEIGKHLTTKPKLLGSIASSRAYGLEKHIHAVLREHWIKNEWFKDCEPVRDAMSRVLNFDELGYEHSSAAKRHAAYVPVQRTHEEWLEMVRGLLLLLWPNDIYSGLADAAEITREQAGKYLLGQEKMPRPIRAVIAAEVIAYCTSDLRERA